MTDGNDGAQRTGCGADELLSAVVEARDSNSVESATSEGADAPSGDRERNDSAPRPKKRARSSHRVAKQHASLLVAGSINGGISTMTSSSSLVTHAKSPQYFRVGCLKERHASWSDLSLYLTYYMHTTQTRIVASETVSFSQQNAVLRATQSSEHEAMTAPVPSSRVSRSSRERLFPEGSDPYSRTFVCRGPYQERQNEEEQRVECPFRFMAHVVRERDAWRILVPSARQHCFHNHPIVGGLRVPRSVVTNIRTSTKQSPTRRRAGKAVLHATDLPRELNGDSSRGSVQDSHVSEPEPDHALTQAGTDEAGADEDQDGEGLASEEEEEDDHDDESGATLEGDEAPSGNDTGSLHQTPQSHLPLVDQQQQGFALREYYESWDELFGVLDEYMHVTCTKLVLRTSCSVAKHNKTALLDSTRRATKQVRSGGNQQMELVPEIWKMASRQFGCTHGWSSTRLAQGSKKKTAADLTRKADERCQFRIRAIVVKVGDVRRIHLPVHLQNRVHNHALRTIFSLSSDNSTSQYSIVAAPSLVSAPAWHPTAQTQFHHQHQRLNGVIGLLLPATRLKEYHESWDDFFAYLGAYTHSTKSNIVIKHTTSVSTRNREILESGHMGYLVPESFKTFAHRFGCGVQEQSSPGTECPFQFTAHVIKLDDVWRIHVPISLQFCTHDHTGSSTALVQRQEPLVATNANLLDIRSIPRDHPLYEAICDLANKQQQARAMNPIGGSSGIPIAPLGSVEASDVRVHSLGTSIHVPIIKHPHQQNAHAFFGSQSHGDYLGGRPIHDSGEATKQSNSSSDEENFDDVEETGDGQETDDDTTPTGVNTTAASIPGEEGSQEVRVASLQEFHASWESLSMYLHEYMRKTKTKIVIGGSTSVSKRNQQMKQTQHVQRSDASTLIPDELSVYYRRYICTHGSNKRIRSQGLRQTRHLRATGCKFQFSAHVAKINNVWCVHVPLKSQCCVHNHPVEQEQFESYASFRMIPKVHPLYDEIRKMVLAGSDKTAMIYDYIRANSSFKVTKKDVRNMIQTMKKS